MRDFFGLLWAIAILIGALLLVSVLIVVLLFVVQPTYH